MINAMYKPRIAKVRETQYWNCAGVLGRSPHQAYWYWHKITGGKRK